jgi:hypothetical protein
MAVEISELRCFLSSASDYKVLATRIRQAVERYQADELIRGSSKRIQLPVFPRVETRGTDIVIIGEDGSEELWGQEADRSKALEAAEDIQEGLRALNFVKNSLVNHINTLMENLIELDVPREHLDDIIYEGYRSLQKWFIRLADSEANEPSS